jgi:hypothetical protein
MRQWEWGSGNGGLVFTLHRRGRERGLIFTFDIALVWSWEWGSWEWGSRLHFTQKRLLVCSVLYVTHLS